MSNNTGRPAVDVGEKDVTTVLDHEPEVQEQDAAEESGSRPSIARRRRILLLTIGAAMVAVLQYRWTRMTDFEPTERRARAMLRPALEQAAMAPDEEHHQGHKKPKPVDFFTPVVPPERLNPNFRALIEDKGFAPARGIIEPMMRWYNDVDGNFIEQFQTTGFDARLGLQLGPKRREEILEALGRFVGENDGVGE